MWDRYKLSQLNLSQINLLLMKNDRSHECGTDTNLSQINVSLINLSLIYLSPVNLSYLDFVIH